MSGAKAVEASKAVRRESGICMMKDARLPAVQDARVPLLQPTICGERHLIRRASG